ncbi:hypothetical protein JQS43_06515 [Natronosporangium hydrolyticum]|uniref:Uncharacterized protein n=1 Tax=Natronosporangium hydrolyticum TaxID=2811111 RepID=A0A895YDX4_9ACTN|nr:hypothetical protein [Natronosporangium hydrolyticum]QSB15977.1 hypothetical protein JQS43_06515 [Natronosporangium hydrolyticum]
MSALRRVGCAAVLLLAALLVPATPAAAEPAHTSIFIELNPSTVQAGVQIEIRASCAGHPKPATVRSRAFGDITLAAHHEDELRGSVTVPTGTRAGEYRVDLRCGDGSRARTDLVVLEMKRPTRGPETGGGGAAGEQLTPPVLLAGAGAAVLAAGAALLLRQRRRTG